ncbi:hypothetical protein, variant 1 [Aphanomyces astaci]|uniref:Uncharacterized protein n=2 Tax=Aphanomyces astaci TaxID=112090 RepID=W4HBL1_APHAT|nr:hypothetical protein, variant 1 [Aphanomyces astaci]ETV89400.1 hypothetical protein, variant 1 [Aphanomyces astaci]|eukprot:XP_009821800.1 hypothetical protein, variant 1 [Aphanomyces astaci]
MLARESGPVLSQLQSEMFLKQATRCVEAKGTLVRALSTRSGAVSVRPSMPPRFALLKARGNNLSLRITAMGVLGFAGARVFMSPSTLCQGGVSEAPATRTAVFRNGGTNDRNNDDPSNFIATVLRFLCGAAVGSVVCPIVTEAAIPLAIGVVFGVHVASLTGIFEFTWTDVEKSFVSTYIAKGQVKWGQLRVDVMQFLKLEESPELMHAVAGFHKWAKHNLYSVEFALGVLWYV